MAQILKHENHPLQKLKGTSPIGVVGKSQHTLHHEIDGMMVTFLCYSYLHGYQS